VISERVKPPSPVDESTAETTWKLALSLPCSAFASSRGSAPESLAPGSFLVSSFSSSAIWSGGSSRVARMEEAPRGVSLRVDELDAEELRCAALPKRQARRGRQVVVARRVVGVLEELDAPEGHASGVVADERAGIPGSKQVHRSQHG
jgi:hypothetical protein